VVGNLYVGGVGKTPVVIALVQQLLALGWTPGVISRGYGIKLGLTARVGKGDVDAQAMGDEPALISALTQVPVGVHPNRRLACEALLKIYPEVDIIVSDDGLQHLALARDLEIIVQDTRRIGNGWLLPAGPLREPPSRLSTVDLVITRQASQPPSTLAPTLGSPTELSTWLQITGVHSLDNKINLSVYEFIKFQENKTSQAIAGISEPDRFFKSLSAAAILYQVSTGLPDHHPLDTAFFEAQQAELLLITAKDAVKCRAASDPRIWVVATEAVFSDPLWAAKLVKQLPYRSRS
jgi:tetraacyldisaccharide 4'-kinase